jgi:polyhydroxybutyrate depolymerase
MRPTRLLLLLLPLGAAACWQPPDLEVPMQPEAAALLAVRPYKVSFPVTEDGGALDAGPGGWPLLVILHAYGNTGRSTQAYLGLDAPSVVSRYAVVLPHGFSNFGPLAWRPAATPEPPWDSAYVRAIIADALATSPLDPRRVYVVGGSQGGTMAHRVACDGAELVSAVVSVAGQLITCEPSRPVSALEVHGTADDTLRYLTNDREPGAVDTISAWGRGDGCTGALTTTGATLDLTTAPGEETGLQAFEGCPPGIDVVLATMYGVPHRPEWAPGLVTTITGFLDAHARP